MVKKLFAFDLDGTLLTGEEKQISPATIKMIERLKNEGHIVCILTGRPWRATKKIYNQLGLNTIVANYNGAHIHNPSDYNYLPIVERIPMSNVANIISNERLKQISMNVAIEGPSYLMIQKMSVDDHFTKTFLKVDGGTKIINPISWDKIISDPTGILIEVNPKYSSNMNLIKNYFESKYGDVAEFSYWETGEGMPPIFEFTNRNARKDIALIRIARFYDIEMENVVAIGDGYNDVYMLKTAGIGVAMANSNDIVKGFANVISKHTNTDDGVPKFVNWLLDKGIAKVRKTQYDFSVSTDEFSTTIKYPE